MISAWHKEGPPERYYAHLWRQSRLQGNWIPGKLYDYRRSDRFSIDFNDAHRGTAKVLIET